jgi:Ca-activated chloride channel family protein
MKMATALVLLAALGLSALAGIVGVVGCACCDGPTAMMEHRHLAWYDRQAAAPLTSRYVLSHAAKPAPGPPIRRQHQDGEFHTETYDRIVSNAFVRVTDHPLSTFSIDVDTASYSNLRRFLNCGQLPPKGAIRIEELINYFRYDYAPPRGGAPFATHVEMAACPWNTEHRLVRIGLKGKVLHNDSRPASNLVFLLDVSGSMQPANKLPLVRKAMALLTEQLGENDRVGIVVYAAASGLVLPSTPCDQKETILAALDRLRAGGSTNGGEGIRLAYRTAVENFIPSGTNRVILCTDGDFNVGVTDQSELIRLIERNAASGVFLSVLGFGMGNYKDSTLEKLADKGNGNYAYIDDFAEARKVLVEQITGTLVTIAKDVKIQVEFNPAKVAAYRLIGYENRLLRKEDFNDDTKDAGEIGAGHTVTALYEIVPAGQEIDTPAVDPLKYQEGARLADAARSDETLTLKLRYKAPDGEKSKLLVFPVADDAKSFSDASADFRFAVAVAAFAMILRDCEHKGNYTIDGVIELAGSSLGNDESPYRIEFVELARKAKRLMGR